MSHLSSASVYVPVHRKAERDEAGGADRTRTRRVVLLPFPRQIQGWPASKASLAHVERILTSWGGMKGLDS